MNSTQVYSIKCCACSPALFVGLAPIVQHSVPFQWKKMIFCFLLFFRRCVAAPALRYFCSWVCDGRSSELGDLGNCGTNFPHVIYIVTFVLTNHLHTSTCATLFGSCNNLVWYFRHNPLHKQLHQLKSLNQFY
jgi:hypothetical protein